jgi:hypothetical protein
MYRKAFKFVVMTITILTANLLTGGIGDMLTKYKYQYKPLTYTLIAMAVITLILYPLYTYMEVWLTNLSTHLVKSGKSLGGRTIGLIIVFVLCIAILSYFYAKMWYDINLLKFLFNGEIQNLI